MAISEEFKSYLTELTRAEKQEIINYLASTEGIKKAQS